MYREELKCLTSPNTKRRRSSFEQTRPTFLCANKKKSYPPMVPPLRSSSGQVYLILAKQNCKPYHRGTTPPALSRPSGQVYLILAKQNCNPYHRRGTAPPELSRPSGQVYLILAKQIATPTTVGRLPRNSLGQAVRYTLFWIIKIANPTTVGRLSLGTLSAKRSGIPYFD